MECFYQSEVVAIHHATFVDRAILGPACLAVPWFRNGMLQIALKRSNSFLSPHVTKSSGQNLGSYNLPNLKWGTLTQQSSLVAWSGGKSWPIKAYEGIIIFAIFATMQLRTVAPSQRGWVSRQLASSSLAVLDCGLCSSLYRSLRFRSIISTS